MFSLEIECEEARRDWLLAELYDLDPAGVVELDSARVRVFFDDAADRARLLARYPAAAVRVEEDRDWVGEARAMLQPMRVGSRFFLVPEWRDDPAPEGRFRIPVNPGRAFGTGVHETTQLCLEALEEFVRSGAVVLDVGTGQGILARAARLLGAGKVVACDIDPVAIEVAGIGFVGSVDAVGAASVDLVVANISPEAIVQLAPDFVRVRRPGGTILASGFEINETEQVSLALPGVRDVRQKGNWALVVA
ncbi:MAG: 50S ribosomal protein L11 methyltransferase [Bryobacteraceae bacterium]